MPSDKEINLVSSSTLDRSPGGKLLQWTLTYGRYIIIGTEIIVLLAFISRFKFDRDLADLREEIAQKLTVVTQNQPFEAKVRATQHRLAQIRQQEQQQSQTLAILRQVESITPPEVFFDSLTLEPDTVTLSVKTTQPRGLTVLIDNMRASSLFSTVVINSVTQDESGTITFTLSADTAFTKEEQETNDADIEVIEEQ